MPVLPAVPSTTTDTPERRAALRKRVMEAADRIRDTVVREYYVNEFRGRLFELFAPPARARGDGWRRDGRPERRPGHVPAEALPSHTTGLVSSKLRLQQALLATMINHPEVLGDFAEQLAAAQFVLPELEALRGATLNHQATAANPVRPTPPSP